MKRIGIYVHIPFCKRKCKYCDFVSFENATNCIQEYIDRVVWDIQNEEKILKENGICESLEDVEIDTIYFGGGTPSFIDSKYILQILEAIRAKFNVLKEAEITIEVNPGTVDFEKLQAYFNSGINRLSIGCQETHDNILKDIGRIHSFEEFLNTYNLARKIGFKNINVDLMLALPNQSLEELEESARKIISLNPEHISLYSLILENGTPLEKEVNQGILKLPSDDLEREMYHKTKKILEENGYIHYEISNFAKNNFYSKHNVNCWKQHEYLGLGLASHSYFNNVRFSVSKNLQKYIEKNSEQVYNINVVKIHEKQALEDKIKEYMILGFRKLDGINKKEFFENFNLDVNEKFKSEISKLKSENLIEENENFIMLSSKGLDLANLVFEEFI